MERRWKGIFLAVMGSVLWGASGIGGQFLMQDRAVSAEWLAAVRMIGAGALLLLLDAARNRGGLFSLWQNKKDGLSLLVFAVVGMVGVQYTYFKAIVLSNAAAATILQYMMPFLVIFWTALSSRRMPSAKTGVCVLLAVGGTVLLVTRGEWGRLAVSEAALFWGLLSAAAAAFYLIQPRRLICRSRSSLVVGWGMLLGGLFLSPLAGFGEASGVWDGAATLALAFVILFGTAAAFWMYLSSVEYIEPSEAGLLNSVEPLSSILFSILFFGMSFGLAECAGAFLIILAVLAVSREKI